MLHRFSYLWRIICVINIFSVKNLSASTFDNDLYKRVLDPELCNSQLSHMTLTEPGISFAFYDAGFRIPRGILSFHLNDWGSYHQCLGINFPINGSNIEGKYCTITVPFQQELTLATWSEVSNKFLYVDEEVIKEILKFEIIKRNAQILTEGRSDIGPPFNDFVMNLGMCIPKACTTEEVFDFITLNGLLGNFTFTEQHCRLPNDKPFVAVDYIAMALFSIIGLLMLLSTCYDLYQTLILKKDSKTISKVLCSFSVYTNTRRLLMFSSSRDALHCLDGIRAIAMLWVIYGHVCSNYAIGVFNGLEFYDWVLSLTGTTLLLAAPMAVDTFFMMSGLLLVYTMSGKLTQRKFLTKIHMFYFLRYLRFFPILAASILMQASLFHHISDGPRWHNFASQVQLCRDNWWSTFLFVANYVHTLHQCNAPTWYMMVEMQLFWISPLVLVWVLGDKKQLAWLALGVAVVLSLVSVTTFCFVYNFPASFLGITDVQVATDYYKFYYMNTLSRATPFFVGMIVGYILHTKRRQPIKIGKIYVFILWALAFASFSFIIFINYLIVQPDYDNQMFDNFLNAYGRTIWAAALGWLVIACVHGYAGPINWLLSLSLWKLPARLSYAMYLFHMPILHVFGGTLVSPIYFTEMSFMYRFMGDTLVTFIWSFGITLAVDSPISTLQKLVFGEAYKSNKHAAPQLEIMENKIERKDTADEEEQKKI